MERIGPNGSVGAAGAPGRRAGLARNNPRAAIAAAIAVTRRTAIVLASVRCVIRGPRQDVRLPSPCSLPSGDHSQGCRSCLLRVASDVSEPDEALMQDSRLWRGELERGGPNPMRPN